MGHDDVIAELRQLLQEVITPDLQALLQKLEEVHGQMRLSERRIVEALATFRAEAEVLRAETAASHSEMLARLEAHHDQLENEQMGEIWASKPCKFVM